ncbi:MAG: hypothetical protein NZ781_12780 [Armatimonadetes bacterium]|nr:hypothetical protein [Armatimonadota bacterium]
MFNRSEILIAILTASFCLLAAFIYGGAAFQTDRQSKPSGLFSKQVNPNDPSFPSLRDYLVILERFPAYAERGWHRNYLGHKNLGYFGDGRSDENGMRTLGNFILVYAYLATRADYDPSVSGVSKDVIKERALSAIRYMIRTHLTGDLKCTDGRQWGNHWQSAWWTSRMLGGATLLWNELTDEERVKIQKVVVYEANRHIGLMPRVGEYFDTKSEENAWDSEILAWALNLYPNHPNSEKWREAFNRLCLNTFSVESDMNDERIIEGKPLKEWVGGACVHPDFTIENHGFFHICYMACPLHSFAWNYYIFRRFGRKPPEVIYHNAREVWERLKQFALWRGQFAYVGGKDWPRYAYGLYFILPALVHFQQVFGDRDARLIERLRVATFEFEQRIHGDGSFFSGRFTRGQTSRWPAEWETDAAANLAISALIHGFNQPPIPPKSLEDFSSEKIGTFYGKYSQFILRRDKQRFVSWCWRAHAGPATGLICSDIGEDMLEWNHNLCGNIVLNGVKSHVSVMAHREEIFDNGFATFGIIEHGLIEPKKPSPYRLVVVDDNVPTAEILAKNHPLFNVPNRISSLKGLTDVDSITEAGEGWNVLARNNRGGPSILEARIGEGIFIISMTNMEEMCTKGDSMAKELMENLLTYVKARERPCGYVRGERFLEEALKFMGVKFELLDLNRHDISKFGVIFIDRSAARVLPHYPKILEFVSNGGVVVHSVIQDKGWISDAISEKKPAAVLQFLAWVAIPDGRSALLIGLWRANKDVTVQFLDLLDWRIANDIFNGCQRQVYSGDKELQMVRIFGIIGKNLGEIYLESNWLNIDNDIGVALWAPNAKLRILDTPERLAPARSLCYARIQPILLKTPGKFLSGHVIAKCVFLFRTRVSPKETEEMAKELKVNWDGAAATVQFEGADKRQYTVSALLSENGWVKCQSK